MKKLLILPLAITLFVAQNICSMDDDDFADMNDYLVKQTIEHRQRIIDHAKQNGINTPMPSSGNVKESPINVALGFKHFDLIPGFLQMGAQVTPTTLFEATMIKRPDLLNVLLRHLSSTHTPADIKKTIDESHALIWAAEDGDLESAQILLDHHADANIGDQIGMTPLHHCLSGDSTFWTSEEDVPLARRLELIKRLFKYNANPCQQDSLKRTPAAFGKEVMGNLSIECDLGAFYHDAIATLEKAEQLRIEQLSQEMLEAKN